MITARIKTLPVMHWDGAALSGDSPSTWVVVTIPLRLVSARSEVLPPAGEQAVKAAARLKAERAFQPLGPVSIEALLPPPRDGAVTALLFAVPRSTIEAVRQAVQARGKRLAAVRIAELCQPVPVGGVVRAAGEAALVALSGGHAVAVAALGPVDAPGAGQLLARERMRLGVDPDAPGGPPPGAALDFLRPGLSAPPLLTSRRGFRLAVLAGLAAAAVLLAGILYVTDALAARAAARAEAERLRPVAKALATRRSEMKEVAGWFEARPQMAPGLHVLAQAMPEPGSADQVRLVRVRQVPGSDAVAEGAAGDRAQMMAFLERLRRDPRVASAEIRSSRAPSRESRGVVFELVFRLKEARDATS